MGDDRTARLARARNLSARLLRLADVGADELRVIDAFVEYVENELVHHGPLDVARVADVEAEFRRECVKIAERYRQIERIEEGLDEIVEAEPVIPRTRAINFGESDR